MKLLAALLLVACAVYAFFTMRGEPDGTGLEALLERHASGLAPKVKTEELQSSALKGTALELGPAPVVTVGIAARPGTRVRQLTLSPATIGVFRVRFDPADGERDAPALPDQDVTSARPIDVTVGERGGTLTITRVGPATPARIDLK